MCKDYQVVHNRLFFGQEQFELSGLVCFDLLFFFCFCEGEFLRNIFVYNVMQFNVIMRDCAMFSGEGKMKIHMEKT